MLDGYQRRLVPPILEQVAGIELVTVSVGNPHAVVRGDPAEIGRIGPLLETNERFPERTNVQVVQLEGPGEVTARVWERGVGETTASGTSAVAVAAATHADGDDVLVHFPGGDLRVRLEHGRACNGSSTPPIPTPPATWTSAPICAHEPTVAHVSTIVRGPTQAPMLT